MKEVFKCIIVAVKSGVIFLIRQLALHVYAMLVFNSVFPDIFYYQSINNLFKASFAADNL
jgi:hypothetical protein